MLSKVHHFLWLYVQKQNSQTNVIMMRLHFRTIGYKKKMMMTMIKIMNFKKPFEIVNLSNWQNENVSALQ